MTLGVNFASGEGILSVEAVEGSWKEFPRIGTMCSDVASVLANVALDRSQVDSALPSGMVQGKAFIAKGPHDLAGTAAVGNVQPDFPENLASKRTIENVADKDGQGLGPSDGYAETASVVKEPGAGCASNIKDNDWGLVTGGRIDCAYFNSSWGQFDWGKVTELPLDKSHLSAVRCDDQDGAIAQWGLTVNE